MIERNAGTPSRRPGKWPFNLAAAARKASASVLSRSSSGSGGSFFSIGATPSTRIELDQRLLIAVADARAPLLRRSLAGFDVVFAIPGKLLSPHRRFLGPAEIAAQEIALRQGGPLAIAEASHGPGLLASRRRLRCAAHHRPLLSKIRCKRGHQLAPPRWQKEQALLLLKPVKMAIAHSRSRTSTSSSSHRPPTERPPTASRRSRTSQPHCRRSASVACPTPPA